MQVLVMEARRCRVVRPNTPLVPRTSTRTTPLADFAFLGPPHSAQGHLVVGRPLTIPHTPGCYYRRTARHVVLSCLGCGVFLRALFIQATSRFVHTSTSRSYPLHVTKLHDCTLHAARCTLHAAARFKLHAARCTLHATRYRSPRSSHSSY